MNHHEHLLTCLAEECAEVGQIVGKALRFGLNDKGPNHTLTNAQYLATEIGDVVALVEMLQEAELISALDGMHIGRKKERVKHFMEYAKQRGTLTPNAAVRGDPTTEAKRHDQKRTKRRHNSRGMHR